MEKLYIDGEELTGWSLVDFRADTATVKRIYRDVPGMDGKIDYTDAFDGPYYNNRAVVATLEYIGDYDEFEERRAEIVEKIHGKVCKITVGYNPDYYYVGRAEIENRKENDVEGYVSLTGDMDPYEYKQNDTVLTYEVDGTHMETIWNLQKRVTPVIAVNGTVSIAYHGEAYVISDNILQIAGIQLKPGRNTMEFSGRGDVTLTFREGRL